MKNTFTTCSLTLSPSVSTLRCRDAVCVTDYIFKATSDELVDCLSTDAGSVSRGAAPLRQRRNYPPITFGKAIICSAAGRQALLIVFHEAIKGVCQLAGCGLSKSAALLRV